MRTLLAAAAFLTLSSAAHAEPVRDDNPAAPHNRIASARSGGETGLGYFKLGDAGAQACVATVAQSGTGYAAQVYVPGSGFGPWVGVYLSDEDAIDEAVVATERLFGATC